MDIEEVQSIVDVSVISDEEEVVRLDSFSLRQVAPNGTLADLNQEGERTRQVSQPLKFESLSRIEEVKESSIGSLQSTDKKDLEGISLRIQEMEHAPEKGGVDSPDLQALLSPPRAGTTPVVEVTNVEVTPPKLRSPMRRKKTSRKVRMPSPPRQSQVWEGDTTQTNDMSTIQTPLILKPTTPPTLQKEAQHSNSVSLDLQVGGLLDRDKHKLRSLLGVTDHLGQPIDESPRGRANSRRSSTGSESDYEQVKNRTLREEQTHRFWEARTLQVRFWLLSQNTFLFVFSIRHFIFPFSDWQLHFSRFYIFNSLLIFALLAYSKMENSHNIIRTAFFLSYFQLSIRSLDFEDSRSTLTEGQFCIFLWSMCILHFADLTIMWNFIEMSHKVIIGRIYLVAFNFLFLLRVGQFNDIMSDKRIVMIFPATLVVSSLYAQFLAMQERINNESFDSLLAKLEQQLVQQKILKNLKESIVIIKKQEIEFVNDQFLASFEQQIRQPETMEMKKPSLKSSSMQLESSWKVFNKLRQFWFEKSTNQEKDQEELRQQRIRHTKCFLNQRMFREFKRQEDHSEQMMLNRSDTFNKLKVTKANEGQSGNKVFSLNHILLLKSNVISQRVYEIVAPGQGADTSTSKDKPLKYVQIKKTRFIENGVERIMLQIIDISTSIMYDQAQAQNSFLGLINACVSHELRNPLNSIISTNVEKASLYNEIETLVVRHRSGQIPGNELHSNMRRILEKLGDGRKIQESSATMMKFMVQDLLDFAQIKAGKFRKNIKAFNIREMVEKVMCIQRKQAESQDITLVATFPNIAQTSFNVKDGMHSPMLETDEDRVMQVLLGLQSNAIKFTEHGKVEVRCIVENYDEPARQFLKVSVIDTGVGIEEEDQEKLFKLFGFVKDKKERNKNGIGLGLVISQQLVQQFNGDISFKSKYGVGSEFTFTFKLGRDQASADESLSSSMNKHTVNGEVLLDEWRPWNARANRETQDYQKKQTSSIIDIGKLVQEADELTPDARMAEQAKRILIVDDQIFNITALESILQYTLKLNTSEICQSAQSGKEALTQITKNLASSDFKSSSYELILMDCNMPIMDGYEVTDRIRQLFHEQGIAPPTILAVTGHTEQMYVKKAFQCGMNAVLSKPVDVRVLMHHASSKDFYSQAQRGNKNRKRMSVQIN